MFMRVYLLADLQSFREALSVLQQQVDDLDELKVNHYQEIVEHEEQVWDSVQSKVSDTLLKTFKLHPYHLSRSASL
jgi:hypothetical protein